LICADALGRGFAAMTLQVRHGLRSLRAALKREIRVIVHHRQSLNSRWGHYSVLLGIDDEGVCLHDPLLGPAKWLDHAEWLKLWCSGNGNREVRGNLAVFIGPRDDGAARCRSCDCAVPQDVACPTCQKAIPLRPSAVLGCKDSVCPERTWDLLFCPWCDAELDRL
jgi:hypothetical protein